MSEQNDFTEEQIQRVLEKTQSDPRKLAKAYLRAVKRAREAELSRDVHRGLNNSIAQVVSGDNEGASKTLRKIKRRIKTYGQNHGT